MERRRVRVRDLGPWYVLALALLKPAVLVLSGRSWRGAEHVPARGGVVLAANHVSLVDPLVLTDFVVFGTGRVARFLAKEPLFRGRGLVARVVRGTGQIPVHRGTADAGAALDAAVAALGRGECVVIYPEGTVTRDPAGWPMLARTGVARLALRSGAPVVPVAQWGAERVQPYGRRGLHLWPRTTVQLAAGPPVDLSPWQGRPPTPEVLREMTEAVMGEVRTLLEQLRGERAPATVHDPRTGRQDERRTA